jgi:hypothetical protein
MRDEDADLIVSGREPRRRSSRLAGLVWLLVGVQAAALAVSVAVAVHYRTEAGRLGPGVSQATSLVASPMPQVTSAALRLPASGGVAGTVVITAAVLPGAVRAQFMVSAAITGGTPGTVYDLIGSDCTTADPRPDEVWATGLTGADGTADLVGYAWTGAVADRYWMALDPSPLSRPPGLHGQFAQGQAAPFPAGQVPCALTSGVTGPSARLARAAAPVVEAGHRRSDRCGCGGSPFGPAAPAPPGRRRSHPAAAAPPGRRRSHRLYDVDVPVMS